MLVAVIIPHEEHTLTWAQKNGHSGSFSQLCSLKQLQDYVLLELKSTADRNKVLSGTIVSWFFVIFELFAFPIS